LNKTKESELTLTMNMQSNFLKIQTFISLSLFFPFLLLAQQIQVNSTDVVQKTDIYISSAADKTILTNPGNKSADNTVTDTTNTNNYINAKSEWGFLLGYGTSHSGWGKDLLKVQTIDFVYRYGLLLSKEMGRSWYRGRHELLIEVPFSYVKSPTNGQMIGVNFLDCWDFTSSKKIVPYIFAGGGPVYTNINLAGFGTRFNGDYQVGAGLRFFVSDKTSFDLDCRFHHISNGGTVKPDIPLNSTKIFFGISFYL